MLKFTLITLLGIFIIACDTPQKEAKKSSSSGMKCGAGKCGANMFDGNSALSKKKKNILAQMREEDKRRSCVLNAKTTKALYNCVRSPKTQHMSTKCGAGKCGEAMQKERSPSSMKCGAGKCGGAM